MKIRNFIIATVCLTVSGLVAEHTVAQNSGTENLYSQYYTPPGASLTDAEMYPAPRQVPAHVGTTYNTYQPLLPHEFMYPHSRNYYNFYAGPDSFYCNMCGGPSHRPGYGVTKTSVRYQNGCSHIAPLSGTIVPFARVSNRINSLNQVRPPRRGLIAGLGARIASHHAGAGGGISSGGMNDCSGCSSDMDGDGTCNDCESYAANWQQAREHSVARTAQSMSNRTNR